MSRSLDVEADHSARSVALAIIDEQGRMRWVNAAFCQLSGTSSGDLVNRRLLNCLPVGNDFDRQRVERALGSRQEVDLCSWTTRNGGETIHLLATFRMLEGDEDCCKLVELHSGAEFMDLGQYKNLSDSVVMSTRDAIIITEADSLDPPGPRIVYVNPAFSRITGYSRDDVIGLSPRILQGPETDRAELDRLRAALDSGEPCHVEVVNYRKDGSAFMMEVDVVHAATADGLRTHLVGVLRDITARHEYEQEIRRLSQVAEETSNAVVITDRDGGVTWVNQSFTRMTGYTLREVVGRTRADISSGPKTTSATLHRMRAAIRSGDAFDGELINYHKTGEPYWVRISASPVKDVGGNVEQFVFLEHDVTRERDREMQLQRTTERLDALLKLSRELITGADLPAFLRRTARASAKSLNAVYVEFLLQDEAGLSGSRPLCSSVQFRQSGNYPKIIHAIQEAGGPGHRPRSIILQQSPVRRLLMVPVVVRRRRWGSLLAVLENQDGTEEEDLQYLQLVANVIAGALLRARQDAEMERLAFEDYLTGLPNRRFFHEEVSLLLELVQRQSGEAAMLYMDLDRFKDINDGLGHQTGDQLLVAVARRLRQAVRHSDVIARLGGDEFGFFLPFCNRDKALEIADRLVAALGTPISIDGRALYCHGSIGITFVPEYGRTMNELGRQADLAMYRAKASRHSPQIFDPSMDEGPLRAATAEGSLREAIATDQLFLHFQPITDAQGHTREFEALVRWEHPHEGILEPDHFLPLAEETGLIRELDWVVLDQAITAAARYGICIAVNLSPQTLQDDSLIEYVDTLLKQHRVPGNRIVVELTEHVLIRPDRIRSVLAALSELGVVIAIDDFGTGYSSFSMLPSFSLDRLKIDRAFVAGLTTNQAVYEMAIRSIISLAHELDMRCVIEGVETAYQRDWVMDNGADYLQGFLYGRPAPLEHYLPDL